MTCIVGLEMSDGVWIAGDSCGSDGILQITYQQSKVFYKGELLLGYTSSFRMGQLLEYHWQVPDHPSGKTDLNYLVTEVVPSLLSLYQAQGYEKKYTDGQRAGGICLLGYRGKLYRMDSDFHLGRNSCGYDAVGSGTQVALGALAALVDAGLRPQLLLAEVLEIASRFCVGVLPPFTILQLTNSKEE